MDVRSILDGALYAAASPLALGSVLAACLAALPRSVRDALACAASLGAASVLALVLPDTLPATPATAAVLLLLGFFLAANKRVSGWWALLVLVPGGIAAGLAAGLPTATPSEGVGTVLALLAVAAVLLVLRAAVQVPARVRHGAVIARRMAGAWIAAVGVLMVALWLRGVA